jgi:hypothetical protein
MAIAPVHAYRTADADPRLVDGWALTGTSPCVCTCGRAAR